MVLDRKRPVGDVYGKPGVRYEQDGRLFSATEEEVIDKIKVKAPVQAASQVAIENKLKDPLPEKAEHKPHDGKAEHKPPDGKVTVTKPIDPPEATEVEAPGFDFTIYDQMTKEDIMNTLDKMQVPFDRRQKRDLLQKILIQTVEDQQAPKGKE